jgi:hypothetical protein
MKKGSKEIKKIRQLADPPAILTRTPDARSGQAPPFFQPNARGVRQLVLNQIFIVKI